MFDLSESVSSNCPQSEGEPMGVNHGLGLHGVGWVLHHLPNITNLLKQEKS